jgi:RHS repeat-associated protein
VSKSVDGKLTKYLVDKNTDYARVIEEYNSSEVIVEYVYGDDLISQKRGNKTSYYHYDGVGSVRALTDSDSVVTDLYTYDAFGNITERIGQTPNDYLFTGEQYDPNIGFYYLRARYMDPERGRFLSMDTWPVKMYDPNTLHRYLYCRSNPVDYIDPSGHFFVSMLMSSVSIWSILGGILFSYGAFTICTLVIMENFLKPGFEARNRSMEFMFYGFEYNIQGLDEMYAYGCMLIQIGCGLIEFSYYATQLAQAALDICTSSVTVICSSVAVWATTRDVDAMPINLISKGDDLKGSAQRLIDLYNQNKSLGSIHKSDIKAFFDALEEEIYKAKGKN